MTTYYIKNKKGERIGKVTVEGSEVTVVTIKRVIKPWVKTAATILVTALVTLACVWMWNWMSERSERWYQECDAHYGYTTDYYTCRQYHIKGGE